MFALLVHQIIGNRHGRPYQNLFRAAAHALFFQLAQNGERQVVVRAQQARAVTMRTGLGGGLDHAGAQALAAHLEQAKAGNPAHLNTRTVCFQLVFQLFLDRVVVLALVHIDKVDDDQTGQITQAQLAGNFFGCLEIGFQGGLFDRTFLGRLARVHVNRDQGFGHSDDDIAA